VAEDLLIHKDEIELGLELLDRQLLDSEGEPCGKVDDIELDYDGSGRPVITAILTNPGALAPRLGWAGNVMYAVWHRLHPNKRPAPIRLGWDVVAKIDFAVHLTVQRREAGLTLSEDWAYDRVLSKVPGL
jgi:sporulation protein YlmC with PRC-barrel domain